MSVKCVIKCTKKAAIAIYPSGWSNSASARARAQRKKARWKRLSRDIQIEKEFLRDSNYNNNNGSFWSKALTRSYYIFTAIIKMQTFVHCTFPFRRCCYWSTSMRERKKNNTNLFSLIGPFHRNRCKSWWKWNIYDGAWMGLFWKSLCVDFTFCRNEIEKRFLHIFCVIVSQQHHLGTPDCQIPCSIYFLTG